MFFLLNALADSFTSKFKLSDLFDFRQGVAVKTSGAVKKGIKYKVVYPSDLNQVYRKLVISGLKDYYTSKEIKDDKLLNDSDYLIACKGQIKGFSMFNSKDSLKNYKGVIATNHMIILRPNTVGKVYFAESYFLHNILDMVVERLINKINNEPGKDGKQSYITISELQDIEIDFSQAEGESTTKKTGIEKLEEFQKFYNEKLKAFGEKYNDWKEKLNSFIEAEKKLEAFNNGLKIDINLNPNP